MREGGGLVGNSERADLPAPNAARAQAATGSTASDERAAAGAGRRQTPVHPSMETARVHLLIEIAWLENARAR
jgi:hypothetical protein